MKFHRRNEPQTSHITWRPVQDWSIVLISSNFWNCLFSPHFCVKNDSLRNCHFLWVFPRKNQIHMTLTRQKSDERWATDSLTSTFYAVWSVKISENESWMQKFMQANLSAWFRKYGSVLLQKRFLPFSPRKGFFCEKNLPSRLRFEEFFNFLHCFVNVAINISLFVTFFLSDLLCLEFTFQKTSTKTNSYHPTLWRTSLFPFLTPFLKVLLLNISS